jgi:hypothetical protein
LRAYAQVVPRSFAHGCAAYALVAVLSAAGDGRAEVTEPFPGVRLVRNTNQALAIVNLCAPGVSVRATRAGEKGKTAQQWATAVGAKLAINGDFFNMNGTFATWGRARGAGEDWPANLQFQQQAAGEHRQWLGFGPSYVHLELDSFNPPPAQATDIVGGHIMLIKGGQKIEPLGDILAPGVTPRPRTAVGLSQDHNTFFLFASAQVLDGNGIVSSMLSLAAQGGAAPIWEATNLDGGGSTQMYVAGKGAIISSTRQVANHWGIFAAGAGAATNCASYYKAGYVAQSWPLAAQPPIVLKLGETKTGTMELKNTGTLPWKPGVVKLATTPRDTPSPFVAGSWLSAHRVSTVDKEIPPGGSFAFPLDLRGNALGPATSQFFGVVAEMQAWFSDQGGPPDNLLEVRVEVVAAEAAGETGGAAGASATGGGAGAAGSAGAAGAAGAATGGKGGAPAWDASADAASQAGAPDGAVPGRGWDHSQEEGCGCRIPPAPSRAPLAMLAAIAAALAARRRARAALSRRIPG